MAFGAYGIALDGLRGDPRAAGFVGVADEAPTVTVQRQQTSPGSHQPEPAIGEERAIMRLPPSGWLEVVRSTRTATFTLPFALTDEMLAHPYLSPLGAVTARWFGYEALHCGAVLVDGVAWALLGGKEAGKSTTLAWLAARGFGVLTDDLLVVESSPTPTCHAGPRFVDLRPPTAERLVTNGLETMLTEVRGGERHRFPLDDIPTTAPLAGFLLLEEADAIEIAPIDPADRIGWLADYRVMDELPADLVALLDLVSLPMAVLRRPKDLDRMDEVVTLLSSWTEERNRLDV